MSNAQHAEPIIECCPLAPTLPLVCSGQALPRRPQLQSLRCSKIAHYSWSCLNLLTLQHGPMPMPTHRKAALIFPVLPSVSTRGRPCGKYIAEGGVASVMGVAYPGILWPSTHSKHNFWPCLRLFLCFSILSTNLFGAQSTYTLIFLDARRSHGIRICIKRKKIHYGKFFYFCADKYIYIKGFQKMKIRPWKGFEKMRFLCFYIIGV